MNSLESLFTGNISYAFAWTMIHSLWQCALIALILSAVRSFTRNHSAESRYLQSIFALAACVLLSVMTFFQYLDDVANAETALAAAGPSATLTYSQTLWEQVFITLNNSLHYLIFLWMLGFALQFSRYVYGFYYAEALKKADCHFVENEWAVRFERLVKNLGIQKKIAFKHSLRVNSACVVGHLKPVVLLPIGLLTTLTVEQVEAVVLHELAHIKRNDYVVNAIQCFVRVVYFFNPALLWVSSQIDQERENVCDDIAVAQCGDKKDLVNGLTQLAILNVQIETVLAANRQASSTLLRIKRLFAKSARISTGVERMISAICASLLVTAMNVSAQQVDVLKTQNTLALAEVAEVSDQSNEEVDRAPENSVVEPVQPVSYQTQASPAAAPVMVKSTSELHYAARTLALADNTSAPARQISDMQVADATAHTPKPAVPVATTGILEEISSPHFDQFYVAQNFAVPLTKKIYLADTQAEFSTRWMDQFAGSTANSYREVTVAQYSRGLKIELKKALKAAGWQVVDHPASDAIQLNAKLVDIYIQHPEVESQKIVLTGQAGQAAIELVFTTPGGQPFMKIVDRRKTMLASSSFVANRPNNYRYFRMLMSEWSKTSVEYLDDVMAAVKSQKN